MSEAKPLAEAMNDLKAAVSPILDPLRRFARRHPILSLAALPVAVAVLGLTYAAQGRPWESGFMGLVLIGLAVNIWARIPYRHVGGAGPPIFKGDRQ